MKAAPHREIERKFLVKEPPSDLHKHRAIAICQGYLAAERRGNEIRLRHKGKKFYLTVKNGTGATRKEHEVRLNREQFETLWPLTEGRRVSKRRYRIPWRRVLVEVDVYDGRNRGLVVAEVEFKTEDACRRFDPPPWFGEEVTGEERFKNRNLATHEP